MKRVIGTLGVKCSFPHSDTLPVEKVPVHYYCSDPCSIHSPHFQANAKRRLLPRPGFRISFNYSFCLRCSLFIESCERSFNTSCIHISKRYNCFSSSYPVLSLEKRNRRFVRRVTDRHAVPTTSPTPISDPSIQGTPIEQSVSDNKSSSQKITSNDKKVSSNQFRLDSATSYGQKKNQKKGRDDLRTKKKLGENIFKHQRLSKNQVKDMYLELAIELIPPFPISPYSEASVISFLTSLVRVARSLKLSATASAFSFLCQRYLREELPSVLSSLPHLCANELNTSVEQSSSSPLSSSSSSSIPWSRKLARSVVFTFIEFRTIDSISCTFLDAIKFLIESEGSHALTEFNQDSLVANVVDSIPGHSFLSKDNLDEVQSEAKLALKIFQELIESCNVFSLLLSKGQLKTPSAPSPSPPSFPDLVPDSLHTHDESKAHTTDSIPAKESKPQTEKSKLPSNPVQFIPLSLLLLHELYANILMPKVYRYFGIMCSLVDNVKVGENDPKNDVMRDHETLPEALLQETNVMDFRLVIHQEAFTVCISALLKALKEHHIMRVSHHLHGKENDSEHEFGLRMKETKGDIYFISPFTALFKKFSEAMKTISIAEPKYLKTFSLEKFVQAACAFAASTRIRATALFCPPKEDAYLTILRLILHKSGMQLLFSSTIMQDDAAQKIFLRKLSSDTTPIETHHSALQIIQKLSECSTEIVNYAFSSLQHGMSYHISSALSLCAQLILWSESSRAAHGKEVASVAKDQNTLWYTIFRDYTRYCFLARPQTIISFCSWTSSRELEIDLPQLCRKVNILTNAALEVIIRFSFSDSTAFLSSCSDIILFIRQTLHERQNLGYPTLASDVAAFVTLENSLNSLLGYMIYNLTAKVFFRSRVSSPGRFYAYANLSAHGASSTNSNEAISPSSYIPKPKRIYMSAKQCKTLRVQNPRVQKVISPQELYICTKAITLLRWRPYPHYHEFLLPNLLKMDLLLYKPEEYCFLFHELWRILPTSAYTSASSILVFFYKYQSDLEHKIYAESITGRTLSGFFPEEIFTRFFATTILPYEMIIYPAKVKENSMPLSDSFSAAQSAQIAFDIVTRLKGSSILGVLNLVIRAAASFFREVTSLRGSIQTNQWCIKLKHNKTHHASFYTALAALQLYTAIAHVVSELRSLVKNTNDVSTSIDPSVKQKSNAYGKRDFIENIYTILELFILEKNPAPSGPSESSMFFQTSLSLFPKLTFSEKDSLFDILPQAYITLRAVKIKKLTLDDNIESNLPLVLDVVANIYPIWTKEIDDTITARFLNDYLFSGYNHRASLGLMDLGTKASCPKEALCPSWIVEPLQLRHRWERSVSGDRPLKLSFFPYVYPNTSDALLRPSNEQSNALLSLLPDPNRLKFSSDYYFYVLTILSASCPGIFISLAHDLPVNSRTCDERLKTMTLKLLSWIVDTHKVYSSFLEDTATFDAFNVLIAIECIVLSLSKLCLSVPKDSSSQPSLVALPSATQEGGIVPPDDSTMDDKNLDRHILISVKEICVLFSPTLKKLSNLLEEIHKRVIGNMLKWTASPLSLLLRVLRHPFEPSFCNQVGQVVSESLQKCYIELLFPQILVSTRYGISDVQMADFWAVIHYVTRCSPDYLPHICLSFASQTVNGYLYYSNTKRGAIKDNTTEVDNLIRLCLSMEHSIQRGLHLLAVRDNSGNQAEPSSVTSIPLSSYRYLLSQIYALLESKIRCGRNISLDNYKDAHNEYDLMLFTRLAASRAVSRKSRLRNLIHAHILIRLLAAFYLPTTEKSSDSYEHNADRDIVISQFSSDDWLRMIQLTKFFASNNRSISKRREKDKSYPRSNKVSSNPEIISPSSLSNPLDNFFPWKGLLSALSFTFADLSKMEKSIGISETLLHIVNCIQAYSSFFYLDDKNRNQFLALWQQRATKDPHYPEANGNNPASEDQTSSKALKLYRSIAESHISCDKNDTDHSELPFWIKLKEHGAISSDNFRTVLNQTGSILYDPPILRLACFGWILLEPLLKLNWSDRLIPDPAASADSALSHDSPPSKCAPSSVGSSNSVKNATNINLGTLLSFLTILEDQTIHPRFNELFFQHLRELGPINLDAINLEQRQFILSNSAVAQLSNVICSITQVSNQPFSQTEFPICLNGISAVIQYCSEDAPASFSNRDIDALTPIFGSNLAIHFNTPIETLQSARHLVYRFIKDRIQTALLEFIMRMPPSASKSEKEDTAISMSYEVSFRLRLSSFTVHDLCVLLPLVIINSKTSAGSCPLSFDAFAIILELLTELIPSANAADIEQCICVLVPFEKQLSVQSPLDNQADPIDHKKYHLDSIRRLLVHIPILISNDIERFTLYEISRIVMTICPRLKTLNIEKNSTALVDSTEGHSLISFSTARSIFVQLWYFNTESGTVEAPGPKKEEELLAVANSIYQDSSSVLNEIATLREKINLSMTTREDHLMMEKVKAKLLLMLLQLMEWELLEVPSA